MKTDDTKAFQLIALTPPGLPDPSLAIAASRAGELGVLDLEYVDDAQAALSAISKLSRYANGDCGVKFAANAKELIDRMMPNLTGQVKVIILTQAVPDVLRPLVKGFHDQKLMVLLEVTSLDQP